MTLESAGVDCDGDDDKVGSGPPFGVILWFGVAVGTAVGAMDVGKQVGLFNDGEDEGSGLGMLTDCPGEVGKDD